MQFIKSKLHQLCLSPAVRRIFHTFWQSFLAVFGLGVTGIISSVLRTHDLADAKSATLALVVAAAAAGFAALKVAYLSRKG